MKWSRVINDLISHELSQILWQKYEYVLYGPLFKRPMDISEKSMDDFTSLTSDKFTFGSNILRWGMQINIYSRVIILNDKYLSYHLEQCYFSHHKKKMAAGEHL